jgi:hypothetical protein
MDTIPARLPSEAAASLQAAIAVAAVTLPTAGPPRSTPDRLPAGDEAPVAAAASQLEASNTTHVSSRPSPSTPSLPSADSATGAVVAAWEAVVSTEGAAPTAGPALHHLSLHLQCPAVTLQLGLLSSLGKPSTLLGGGGARHWGGLFSSRHRPARHRRLRPPRRQLRLPSPWLFRSPAFLTRPPCHLDRVHSSRPPSVALPPPCPCCRPSSLSPPPPCSL